MNRKKLASIDVIQIGDDVYPSGLPVNILIKFGAIEVLITFGMSGAGIDPDERKDGDTDDSITNYLMRVLNAGDQFTEAFYRLVELYNERYN